MKPKISLVSIGHIDHGKSTLVGRLLYDATQTSGKEKPREFAHFLDSLEEERERGITIDIVHTPFESSRYRFEIIDCPGHKEFIKNMMSGTSRAGAAQLLVSAAPGEGIQEQTIRHLWLAKLFGINQIVVVINKMDLSDYSEQTFLSLKTQVVGILSNLEYLNESTAFVPTSGKEGENVFFKTTKMPWWQGGSYLETLETTLTPPTPLTDYHTRFSIQSTSPNVVGRVESGTLRVRDALRLEPGGDEHRLLAINGYDHGKQEALAGESIALELKGNLPKLARGKLLINRIDKTYASKSFKARIYCLAEGGLSQNSPNLKIRAGLQEISCSLKFLSLLDPLNHLNPLSPTEALSQNFGAEVEISTSAPIFVEPFSKNPATGRILIEQDSQIVAAGVVASTEDQPTPACHRVGTEI